MTLVEATPDTLLKWCSTWWEEEPGRLHRLEFGSTWLRFLASAPDGRWELLAETCRLAPCFNLDLTPLSEAQRQLLSNDLRDCPQVQTRRDRGR